VENVQLMPLTAKQYEVWLPRAIAEYAEENVASGRWSADEAPERSRTDFAQLLPQGIATPSHRIWSIVRTSDREPVGVLWINVVEKPTPRAFIYNIEIFPAFRRNGFATQAMLRLEDEAKRLGLDRIGLHVFGHNTAARPLYEKLGYVATNINMSKGLT
jgi:RimJ/RimL family protein N-acetyltransferase